MPFADAVQVFTQLCDVVEYCHARGGLHRDIKPDNVILRDGRVDAVLVDFGLTFNSGDESHFSTGDWEELGNRFLRLPELSSFGLAKRDARSDVAFLTGILFFCLFGKVPAVLEDEAGRLPHQRDGIDLAGVCPDNRRVQILAAIFDRGFRPRIMERFQHVNALRQEGTRLLGQDIDPNESDPEELARELREQFFTETSKRQRQRKATLSQAVQWVEEILREVAASLHQEFVPISSGFYDPNTDHPWKNMGLHHHYREHHMRFWMRTNFVFVGAEFLITVQVENGQEEEILRTDAEQPSFAVGNRANLKLRLLKGISQIMLERRDVF